MKPERGGTGPVGPEIHCSLLSAMLLWRKLLAAFLGQPSICRGAALEKILGTGGGESLGASSLPLSSSRGFFRDGYISFTVPAFAW